MSRRATLLLVLAALAAVAAVAYRAFFTGGNVAIGPSGGNETGAKRAATHSLETSTSPRGDDDALAAERTNEGSSKPSRDQPDAWAEGVITLLELDDGPPPWRTVDAAQLNGSFVPDWIDGPEDDAELDPERTPEDDPRRVLVTNGRFRVDTRGATVMLVRALVLDGLAAAVDGGVELSSDTPAQVKARWIPSCLLHVVDATTHEELRDVTVVSRPYGPDLVPGIVLRSEIAAEHRASPFHLRLGERPRDALITTTPWVGAPGHAWRKVALEFSPGATKTVELDAGACLIVTVTGLEEGFAPGSLSRAPRLLLREPAGGAALVDARATDTPMELDGLPIGEFVTSLEVGDDSAPHRVLCSADLSLAAGACERVTFKIAAGALVDAVPVAGTLYAPPSWRDRYGFAIRLRPAGIAGATRSDRRDVSPNDLEPVRGKEGWFRWSAGSVVPGTYLVDVDRAGLHVRVEVGPSGRDDVELLLPDATRLVVRVVDAESKQPVRIGRLCWHPVDDPPERPAQLEPPGFDGAMHSETFELLRFDETVGAFVGVAAAGEGHFSGESMRYRLRDGTEASTYTACAGTNEFVLEALRNCGVELSFDDAAASFGDDGPITVEWKYLVSGAAGTVSEQLLRTRHAMVRTNASNDEFCVAFPRPGRYRIAFPTCTSLAPFEVDVPEGEFVKCEVRK